MNHARKTKGKKVLLLIEHYQREYEFASLLCARIKKAGFHCTILHIHFDFMKILFAAPFCHALIYPFYYTSTDTPIHRVLRKLPYVRSFNLAWEQTNYQANSKNKVPRDDIARKSIVHFLWNKNNLNSYKVSGAASCILLNIPNYNYITLGIPGAINTRNALHLLADKGKDSLFFADNLSWLYYSQQKLDELFRTRTIAKEDAEKIIDYSGNYLRRLLADCSANPKIKLLFRLRPNVSPDRFNSILNGLGFDREDLPSNVLLVLGLTSNQFIASGIPIVSNNSTILLDAYHAGRYAFRLNYADPPAIFQYEWSNHIVECFSLQEALELSKQQLSISTYLDFNYTPPISAVDQICNTITGIAPPHLDGLKIATLNFVSYCLLGIVYAFKHQLLVVRPKTKFNVETHFSRDKIYHANCAKLTADSLMSISLD
jgi:hypothetical protein